MARLLGLDKELIFSAHPAKKLTVADLQRALSTHYEGTPDEVKPAHDLSGQKGSLAVCRDSTALSLVCEFAAKPSENELLVAWGPPCRTPFERMRPYAGELPDGCLVGPEARKRLDGHMKPEPGVGSGPRLR